jgi:hypothetical protein
MNLVLVFGETAKASILSMMVLGMLRPPRKEQVNRVTVFVSRYPPGSISMSLITTTVTFRLLIISGKLFLGFT